MGYPLLALADSEYLGAANGANTLGRWLAVLQRYVLRVFNLPFSPTLKAVSLRHLVTPFLCSIHYTLIGPNVKR